MKEFTPDQVTIFSSCNDTCLLSKGPWGGNIHSFEYIISIENLLISWQEFLKGKRKRKDVALFQLNLMGNIFALHTDLVNRTYFHGRYQAFKVNDPKPRDIHKASVRDRLLHHAVYRILYPYFDKKFIYDSYSCRKGKGTHKAMDRFREFSIKVSKNNTKTCWILKCDIKKFFANINHEVLKSILERYIEDKDILWLLNQVISSFNPILKTKLSLKNEYGKGLPLGNLTSQLLVNIYMNEFDQYMKHKLKVKYYIRYADDFVILQNDRMFLEELLTSLSQFLKEELKLEIHPDKVFIKTLSSGVDFLGWVHFGDHRVLRTSTKKRMFNKLKYNPKKESLQSYLGMLRHGSGFKLKIKIENLLDKC